MLKQVAAFLLIPCLLVDPALSVGAPTPNANAPAHAFLFEQQALEPHLVIAPHWIEIQWRTLHASFLHIFSARRSLIDPGISFNGGLWSLEDHENHHREILADFVIASLVNEIRSLNPADAVEFFNDGNELIEVPESKNADGKKWYDFAPAVVRANETGFGSISPLPTGGYTFAFAPKHRIGVHIEDDGIIVLIDPRFLGGHAGRWGIVMAPNQWVAQHELRELRTLAHWAVKVEGIASKEDILDGQLGLRIRTWLNKPPYWIPRAWRLYKFKKIMKAAHAQGRWAEQRDHYDQKPEGYDLKFGGQPYWAKKTYRAPKDTHHILDGTIRSTGTNGHRSNGDDRFVSFHAALSEWVKAFARWEVTPQAIEHFSLERSDRNFLKKFLVNIHRYSRMTAAEVAQDWGSKPETLYLIEQKLYFFLRERLGSRIPENRPQDLEERLSAPVAHPVNGLHDDGLKMEDRHALLIREFSRAKYGRPKTYPAWARDLRPEATKLIHFLIHNYSFEAIEDITKMRSAEIAQEEIRLTRQMHRWKLLPNDTSPNGRRARKSQGKPSMVHQRAFRGLATLVRLIDNNPRVEQALPEVMLAAEQRQLIDYFTGKVTTLQEVAAFLGTDVEQAVALIHVTSKVLEAVLVRRVGTGWRSVLERDAHAKEVLQEHARRAAA